MNELVSLVISAFSYLTLFGQILAVVLLLLFFSPVKKGKIGEIKLFFSQNALTFVFIVASIATMGSLFLSEVALFVPCKLCWWQRIFMYPISIISLIALVRNDKKAIFYIMPLSLIGIGIATYHCLMQLFPNLLECSEETAKCSAVQFAEFGYITIPVMALTAFVLIFISSLYLLKNK